MAHFAKLDENNVVLNVIVVDNNDIADLPFPESENAGRDFLGSVFPDVPRDRWVQTSYNNNFRVRYAGIGFEFIPTCAATSYGGFCPPKPAEYFVFDDSTCVWKPPVPYPDDGKTYSWDFENTRWKLLQMQPSVEISVIG